MKRIKKPNEIIDKYIDDYKSITVIEIFIKQNRKIKIFI